MATLKDYLLKGGAKGRLFVDSETDFYGNPCSTTCVSRPFVYLVEDITPEGFLIGRSFRSFPTGLPYSGNLSKCLNHEAYVEEPAQSQPSCTENLRMPGKRDIAHVIESVEGDNPGDLTQVPDDSA